MSPPHGAARVIAVIPQSGQSPTHKMWEIPSATSSPGASRISSNLVSRALQTVSDRAGGSRVTLTAVKRDHRLTEAEVLETLLELGNLAAAINQPVATTGPCRMRFGVDIELHHIAFFTPG